MSQELVISSNPIETTVAILQDDRLVEICVEHRERRALVGSIFKGRVTRVLPGMQSAFVNLGLARDAFLYVTDVLDPAAGDDGDLDAGPIEAELAQSLQVAASADEPSEPGEDERQAEEAARGADDLPGQARGRRRRRRPADAAGREGFGADDPEPSEADGDDDGRFDVIPGESIAKYRDAAPGQDHSRDRPGAVAAAEEAAAPADAHPKRSPTDDLGRVAPADTARGRAGEQADAPASHGASDDSGPGVVSANLIVVGRFATYRTNASFNGVTKSIQPTAERKRLKRLVDLHAGGKDGGFEVLNSAAGVAEGDLVSEMEFLRGLCEEFQQHAARYGPEGGTEAAVPYSAAGAGEEGEAPAGSGPAPGAQDPALADLRLGARYLLYRASAKKNSCSRRIQRESERKRLKKIVDSHAQGVVGGFEALSGARGIGEEELVADLESIRSRIAFLRGPWEGLRERAARYRADARVAAEPRESEAAAAGDVAAAGPARDESPHQTGGAEAPAAGEAVGRTDDGASKAVAEELAGQVLPGESIARYGASKPAGERGDGVPEPAGASEGPAGESDTPAAGTADGASGPAAVRDEGAGAIPASEPAAAPDPSEGPDSGDSLAASPEPPRRSASVEAPSAVAELRIDLVNWLKSKVGRGSESAPRPEPPTAREPRRPADAPKGGARRKTSPRADVRPIPGLPREAPVKKAKVDAKAAHPKRPQEGRRKTGTRSLGGRRAGAPQRDKQPGPQANIDDLLKSGQEVIVQVNKEPVGAKGARVTAHVSLPGRYMVYMTTAKHHGVSRKIQPESERIRLRKIVDAHSDGKPGGFVVRSAARNVSEQDLVADLKFLQKLWEDLQGKASKRRAPAKLHSDLGIVERVLRDNLGQSYKTVWVDSEDEFERIMRFAHRFQPEMAGRVKLYTRPQPMYDQFGISKSLEDALNPKVRLPSGGYIVINQTEALVAIDVNTGKYVGKSNRLEDTVLKTNLEAAEEIVRQVRLRDLGGIIVIDFIDMEDRKNRQSVHQVLQEALKKMSSPSRLLPFNDFGLVVITRKAMRQSLERALCIPCPACSGAGSVKSSATVLSEIFSAADRIAARRNSPGGGDSRELTLRVHPEVAKSLKSKGNSHLEDLEATVGANILVRGDSSMHPERFTLDS